MSNQRKFSLTENNKGLLCGIKLAQGEELPCEEGWCSGCQIWLDYKAKLGDTAEESLRIIEGTEHPEEFDHSKQAERSLPTSEDITKEVIWSAMVCAYANAVKHPGEGLLNFYTPESFVAELQIKLARHRLDRPELRVQ